MGLKTRSPKVLLKTKVLLLKGPPANLLTTGFSTKVNSLKSPYSICEQDWFANLKASSRGVRARWDSPSGDRCTGLHYFCAPLYLVNISTCSPSSLLLPPKHGGIFPALRLSAALVKPMGMKNLMRNLSWSPGSGDYRGLAFLGNQQLKKWFSECCHPLDTTDSRLKHIPTLYFYEKDLSICSETSAWEIGFGLPHNWGLWRCSQVR